MTRQLLEKAAKQFRFYESEHRRKASDFQMEDRHLTLNLRYIRRNTSLEKAEANMAIAAEIENYLDKPSDPYLSTVDRLEPNLAMIDTGGGLASIAISLKRIADSLEMTKDDGVGITLPQLLLKLIKVIELKP